MLYDYGYMAITLASPIGELRGVGPSRARSFQKMGIEYVRDLLFHFPRKYEDFSVVTPISQLEVGKQMTVRGEVVSIRQKAGFYGKRRLLRIYVDIDDGTGIVHVVWFNLKFLADKLPVGTTLYIAGTVEEPKFMKQPSQDGRRHVSMRSPAMEFATQEEGRIHTAAITPIYNETSGISSRFIRYQMKSILPAALLVPEYIPQDIIERNLLLGIQQAIQQAHFPDSQEMLEQAKHRLQFDELFFLQLAALVRKQHMQQANAYALASSASERKGYIAKLPFSLTAAQKQAFEEIADDMALSHPMNRLLQGDVGSGKSAVALLATNIALHQKRSVLYLAPTEILARQQALSFTNALPDYRVELLVGAMKNREKQRVYGMLQDSDEPVCIIGTHALLQEHVRARNVGLAIVDEQHRFGVAQRKALLSLEEGIVPHLLSMTATPIPRTLSLTVYGDLDTSLIQELPPGRKPIVTKIVSPDARDDAIIHMLAELHEGRQAYVITPVIEDSPKLAVKSAKKAYEEITKLFPGIAVGMLHGQMTSEEKDSAMNNFAAGAIQLLVATAVVEVGVNVPNATVMMIEGAERFGLAQLHQFRGRIGRGEYASTCYLAPSTQEKAESKRLALFASTSDGFAIAEADLQFRGPGELYGVEQSGFGNLRVASLLDYELISLVRKEAKRILQKDPNLVHHPILQKKVEQKNALAHFE